MGTLRRGRGYKNLRYLLLKAQRMAVAKMRVPSNSRGDIYNPERQK